MNFEINFDLTDATGKRFEFKTLNQLKSFLSRENTYWAEANASLHENIVLDETFTQASRLQQSLNQIESWKANESWDESSFSSAFQQLIQSHLRHFQNRWIWHGHAFVPTWINLFKIDQPTADAFLATMLNKPPSTITTSVNHLKGHILAYEFLMQDESEISKRRIAERRAASQLRTELNDKTDELIEKVDAFFEEVDQREASTKAEFHRLYEIRRKLAERQIRHQKRQFTERLHSWEENVQNLEKTYEEMLRLRKPAEYWNKSAKKYRSQGFLFSFFILFFVAIGLFYLREFFVAWLQGVEIEIEFKTIKGIVIFGTLVAVYAFMLRVASRLAFSSFHLMRDSEEREQLTYLYLSLSEETNVDEQSRQIILQSLFSRSETGLLAQEHGPSLPGVGEAVKVVSRSKAQ